MTYSVFVGQIEPGIPLPEATSAGRGGRTPTYPFAMMMPGDSFLTDGAMMGQVAKNWAKNHDLDWKFAVRAQGGGRTRVWRVS